MELQSIFDAFVRKFRPNRSARRIFSVTLQRIIGPIANAKDLFGCILPMPHSPLGCGLRGHNNPVAIRDVRRDVAESLWMHSS